MDIGQPLSPRNRQVGEAIGIRKPASVRVMVLSEIPLPGDPELRRLAEQNNLITSTTAGMTFGYGIVLKVRSHNRHLIAHELGHVFQYERFGGIEPFLAAYIPEVVFPPYYPNGPLEQEAERLADIVCPIW